MREKGEGRWENRSNWMAEQRTDNADKVKKIADCNRGVAEHYCEKQFDSMRWR